MNNFFFQITVLFLLIICNSSIAQNLSLKGNIESSCIQELNAPQVPSFYELRGIGYNVNSKNERNSDSVKKDAKYKRREILAGIDFGAAGSTIGGKFNNYYTSFIGFALGFDFAFNDLYFLPRGITGFGNVQSEFDYDERWNDGERASFTVIDSGFGYLVYESFKLRILPSVGPSLWEFSSRGKDEESELKRIYSFSGTVGLSIDIKLGKKSRYRVIRNDRSFITSRFRLSVTPMNINDRMKGTSINFSMGVGFYDEITIRSKKNRSDDSNQ